MTMHKITMTVHHDGVLTTEAEGRYLHEALTALLLTPLGSGYGPTSHVAKARVLSGLARDGKSQHGWADFTTTEVE